MNTKAQSERTDEYHPAESYDAGNLREEAKRRWELRHHAHTALLCFATFIPSIVWWTVWVVFHPTSYTQFSIYMVGTAIYAVIQMVLLYRLANTLASPHDEARDTDASDADQ